MRMDEVDRVLDRFVAEVSALLRPVSLCAHGSLAMGDFQPGRSDLDLIAVIEQPLSPEQTARLTELHERLDREEPAAEKLHCSYMAATQLTDFLQIHFTWAHQHVHPRDVSPVTRRELLQAGRVFAGKPPKDVLPDVTDAELADFVRETLGGYWYKATGWLLNWRMDIWVDLGMLTYARSVVTLRDGRLVTKGEALGELGRMGAPENVVADIRQRRYAPDGEVRDAGPIWRVRRGLLARSFVRKGIRRTMAETG
jgi:predicted nucleotidyltransferase